MLTVVVGVLILVCGAFGQNFSRSDQYVDNVLHQQLVGEINYRRLDPAPIGNFHTEFTEKIGIIKTKVRTDFALGNVTGLNKSVRYNSCGAPYFTGFNRANVTLNCTIAFNSLALNVQGKTKIGIAPAVTINARANVTTTVVFIEVTTSNAFNAPRLTKFNVVNMGMVQPKFTGAGPLNNVLKPLTTAFQTESQTQIYALLTNQYAGALNQAVSREFMPKP